jgi:tRNA-splicing ligase RtcB (3'-phosphate/5'-hydroxy nucleic acid ligase)
MKNISQNIFILPRKGGMNVDVHVFPFQGEKPDETLLEHLRNAAKIPSVLRVIGLPNLSPKQTFVSGCVVATENTIVPGIISADINAGIRLIATSLKASEIRVAQFEQGFRKAIPLGENGTNILLHEGDFRLVLEFGISALADIALRNSAIRESRIETDEESDIRRTNDGGSLSASSSSISHHTIELAHKQLGTIGGADHSIDILSVEGIFDEKVSSSLSISKDQVVISFSAGSRSLGHYVMEEYVRLAREINGERAPERGLCHLDANSNEAEMYFQAYNCACNFAYANRQIITALIRHELRKFSGATQMPLVLDIPYYTLTGEQHNQRRLWVHRCAVAKTIPPDDKGKHGSIVLLKGSLNGSSYILSAGKESTAALNSININSGSASSAYKSTDLHLKSSMHKNADDVVRSLVNLGLVNIVARLKSLSSICSV